MTPSRVLRWVTGSLEIVLAIPFFGASIVMGFAYVPLLVMLALHILTLVLSVSNREPSYGSIMGIVTSVLAWIPFVGFVMHLITGILLMVSAAGGNARPPHHTLPPHHARPPY
ncbi:hypothetical protein [Paenibacillus sp. 598K]|uniref:hypothetical protein n=1 Tax=Paenibacillus sp. 598K TaxID=1117987 RepID=UPI000FFE8934|nr:hypothetical protein [Paenibacillus sp. 598K]